MTDTAPSATGLDRCRGVVVGEVDEVQGVLDSDPLVAVPAAEKLAVAGALPGPEGMLLTIGGPERALLFVGTSVLPLRGGRDDLRTFGAAVAGLGVGTMSVHGRRDLVADLWETLAPAWGAPREYRDTQHLMAARGPVDPALTSEVVRPARLDEFEAVLPAAAAMYREELGADPFEVGGGVPFRRRVARSLARRRTWVRMESGRVVFKADIAAISARCAQIQGVWVHPDHRGRGLGTVGIATVCADLRSRGLTPSLVVNQSNVAAVRSYRRVGMVSVVPYATVLTY